MKRFFAVLAIFVGFGAGLLTINYLRAGTAYYVDTTLGSPCVGNYSISSRNCTGSDGNAYTTIAAGVAVLTPGDILYLRGGTYSEQINLATPTVKNGTAGFPITIGGYPGDSKPILNGVANDYGLVRAWNNNYIIIQDLVLDGVNLTGAGGIWAYGNHDITYQRLEIKNQNTSGFYIDANASNITIKDNYIHDARTDCAVGHRWYAIYVHTASNVQFINNFVENMPGGAGQLYPGNVDNAVIKGNIFKNVGYCQTSNLGGFFIAPALGNTVTNTTIADNVFYHLGYAYGVGTGGYANAITIDSRGTTSNTLIANNTVYDLHRTIGGQAYGILVRTNLESGLIIRNNLIAGTDDDAILNLSASATISHNACVTGKNCGSTGRVTLSAITDCTISTTDFRLKQGTNACRDVGTTVASRSNPIGAPDIGAYEQGKVASAAVVNGYIEVTHDVTTPGLQPSSGLTGYSVACIGCTGTPVVVGNVKSSAQNVVQLSVSNLSTSGTCTVSLGSTNVTDTNFIGGTLGSAQGLNSASAQSVTGTCQNTTGGGGGSGGGTSPGTPWSDFKLDEGSGTTATDSSGSAHNGTVSAGVTWVTGGVTIPTDTTYRSISSTYGSGINPTTQDFGSCVYLLPDVSNSQKVVLSPGSNGTSQRWYAGWYTVGGQPQWGIGAQASGFTTGSEFVASNKLTLVCLINDATTDTVTLWVDGVKGTQSGASVKSVTSYTLTGNIIAGNDGTNTINNGGATFYQFVVWNTKPTDADIQNLYTSLTSTPSGSTTTPCLSQSHIQFQDPYTTSTNTPINLSAKADGSLDVVKNGGVMLEIQYTCTGASSATVAPRLYYSRDGVTFNLVVPQTQGTDGVSMWGTTSDKYFNQDVISGCVNAAGLTPTAGITILNSVAGNAFSLSANQCRADRYGVRFGSNASGSYWFRVITDSGLTFANGYAGTVKVNVIAGQAHG